MFLTLLAVLVLFVAFVALARAPRVLCGVWTLNFDPDFSGQPGSATCTFKQDGVKLTGHCGNDAAAHPSITAVSRQKVTSRVPTGQRDELIATLTADVDHVGRRVGF